MRNEVPRHEKIRFRRSDIARLDELPSAATPLQPSGWASLPRKAAKLTFGAALGVAVLSLAVVALVYVAAASGVGDERLRREAEAAITALAGADMSTTIGSTRISIDSDRFLALEVRDVEIASAKTGEVVADIGAMHFGLRFRPLLRGELKLGSARLGQARIIAAAMPRADGGGRGLPVYNRAGLIDPDRVTAFAFDAINRLFDVLERGGTGEIRMEDVEFAAAAQGRSMRIASAILSSAGEGRIGITAGIEIGGRTISVEGSAARDEPAGRIADLSLTIASQAPQPGGGAGIFGGASNIGDAEIVLKGSQTGEAERLAISARFDDAVIGLGRKDKLPADVYLAATALAGTDKIEIERLRIGSGRSTWSFHGAVGPTPDVEGQDEPASYRYELVSDGSTIAPQGSPEPALRAVARLAGHYFVADRTLAIDEIGLRAPHGELAGEGAVRFETGETPGLSLTLEVADMAVSHVKQIWPWFAARGARNWVMSNVYGGRIGEGQITLGVPPGRMGNGVPFGPEEISGRFTIDGTRFDVAGRIPPVRDGVGSVAFAGTDVDVALSSGTVFMPSGRTVDASGGTLTIREAHIKPVIGELEIGVAGRADAVMELASYDPIDVDRFIDLKPDDLAGDVSGRVFADIPLQRDIPAESLDWRVALDYEDLSIAQPFEGQLVTEAEGSIEVDPTRAAIDATARLNGAPAEIAMVEPLGRSEIERQRDITLELDDEARRAIVPGLDVLLSGTASVEVDDSEKDKRAIEADLARATLTIPWVGWSKGSGVPAEVSFSMATEEGRTELSDFRLTGETFGATGSIAVEDGSVTRARFPSAKLNRSDDFSVDIAASGKGYAVTVRGNSIDARSVVKLYSKDSTGGAGEGEPVPVTVDLEVGSMTGFHGETLSDVTLKYSGTGTDSLEFSATTRNGKRVTFSDGRNGESRTVSMRSDDAGAVLRFLDIYEHMEGGDISLSLRATGDGPLTGQVDARNFWIVNEPRLSSLVTTAPSNDGRSLNQAVRGEIDVSRVEFERGFSLIEKGRGYLDLERGVLRGPLIGSTFQGTLYDPDGNMAMTGTFMPAYGLNRIFGEIPLIGQILGNGRDRGLIGITFKLAGKAGAPQLQVNPLSVIAPGIFRSVFEFR